MAFRTRGTLPAWLALSRTGVTPPQLRPQLPAPLGLTPGSVLEGITDFILLVNPVLTCGLHIEDKLVLCQCHTDTIFASLLLH